MIVRPDLHKRLRYNLLYIQEYNDTLSKYQRRWRMIQQKNVCYMHIFFIWFVNRFRPVSPSSALKFYTRPPNGRPPRKQPKTTYPVWGQNPKFKNCIFFFKLSKLLLQYKTFFLNWPGSVFLKMFPRSLNVVLNTVERTKQKLVHKGQIKKIPRSIRFSEKK